MFFEVDLLSSRKETKQAHQIQSIMLQAFWHSNFLHICFKFFFFFTISITENDVFSIPPKTDLSSITCVGLSTHLKATVCHISLLLHSPGKIRKRSERCSNRFWTTAGIMVIYVLNGHTNLV